MSHERSSRSGLPFIALGLVACTVAAWFVGTRTSLLGPLSFGNQRLLRSMRLAIREALPESRGVQLKFRRGQFVLTGPVLKSEYKKVLMAVYAIPEVHDVIDALQIFESQESLGQLVGDSH